MINEGWLKRRMDWMKAKRVFGLNQQIQNGTATEKIGCKNDK